ncbi:MAG TPA: YraN family protein [Patescibacteria group bacterium]|nr:YraN family protein [Patescibacteria group bacterium]
MSNAHVIFGKLGENSAVGLLKAQGYKILAENYRTPLGEIDVVAQDGDTFCFIEVKSRHSSRKGLPQEAVSRQKQRQISKNALFYLKAHKLMDKRARFDVVSVMDNGGSLKLDLIKSAFELSREFTY